MPTYFPISAVPAIQASASDLLQLSWRLGKRGNGDGIVADFIIPNDEKSALRAAFDNTIMLRVLDEMYLSTEEDAEKEGLIPEHFAYRVENAKFWRDQSTVLKVGPEKATHYRLVTGWTCLDVLAFDQPRFSVIPRPEGYSSGWRDD